MIFKERNSSRKLCSLINRKAPELSSGALIPISAHLFSHPDFTVGTGILFSQESPVQPPKAGRGLYRRLGIKPYPEDFPFN